MSESDNTPLQRTLFLNDISRANHLTCAYKAPYIFCGFHVGAGRGRRGKWRQDYFYFNELSEALDFAKRGGYKVERDLLSAAEFAERFLDTHYWIQKERLCPENSPSDITLVEYETLWREGRRAYYAYLRIALELGMIGHLDIIEMGKEMEKHIKGLAEKLYA